jgi:hypothetical protein
MESYLGRRIMKVLEPTLKRGDDFGVYDGESYHAIERAILAYIEDGKATTLTSDSLELYDVPGVEAYAQELNDNLNVILRNIDTATFA